MNTQLRPRTPSRVRVVADEAARRCTRAVDGARVRRRRPPDDRVGLSGRGGCDAVWRRRARRSAELDGVLRRERRAAELDRGADAGRKHGLTCGGGAHAGLPRCADRAARLGGVADGARTGTLTCCGGADDAVWLDCVVGGGTKDGRTCCGGAHAASPRCADRAARLGAVADGGRKDRLTCCGGGDRAERLDRVVGGGSKDGRTCRGGAHAGPPRCADRAARLGGVAYGARKYRLTCCGCGDRTERREIVADRRGKDSRIHGHPNGRLVHHADDIHKPWGDEDACERMLLTVLCVHLDDLLNWMLLSVPC